MKDAALLAVWVIGLFTLIGGVMAAVVRFVQKELHQIRRANDMGAFSYDIAIVKKRERSDSLQEDGPN